MHIGINPIALSIGSWSLRWYGVMVLLAIIFLLSWSLYFAKRVGYSNDFIFGAALWAIPSGFIGAKLVHVVDNISHYLAHPSEIFNPAGLAIFGAILGATFGIWAYSRIHHSSFALLADTIAPGIILAQAIGRVGCTINGCCYGKPSSLPWAVTWTNPNSYAPIGVAVHPTQIYELLWDLVVFALLWGVLRKRLKPTGSLFAAYLALYSLGSFCIRFLRGDVSTYWGIFNEGQIICLLVFLAAVGFLLKIKKEPQAKITRETT